MAKGRTGSIRQEALTKADFRKAEQHGKRLDTMGPARQVRDVPPLVFGSLDLEEARAAHMKGVQQQGKTEAIHMLVQFPTDIPLGPDPERTQKAMLDHAVRFANQYHGGDAVFAARLDRDEQGQHTVDVFAMPRYDFTYKDGRTIKRAAVSKFSKEQARARSEALQDPGETLEPDSPIMQGRALQAAWHEYLRDECRQRWVQPPERKKVRSKDRLEPEELALKRKKQDAEAEAVMMVAQAREEARREADEIKAKAAQEAAQMRAQAKGQIVLAMKEIEDRKAAVERDAALVAAARRSVGHPAPEIEAIAARRRRQRPDEQH